MNLQQKFEQIAFSNHTVYRIVHTKYTVAVMIYTQIKY